MKYASAIGLWLLGAALPAAAAEPARADALRRGWYVAPMLAQLETDKDRRVDDVAPGKGYLLAVGYRFDFASIEASLDSFAADRDDGAGEATLRGGGINALLHPFGGMPVIDNLHLLLGFGAHERANHPHFDDDDTTYHINAGVGYQFPLKAARWDLAIRADLRYRLDTQQPPFASDATPRDFEDWIYAIGVTVPLGRKPARTAPAERVAVVPAAPQPGDTVVLSGVNFESASDQLTAEATAILDAIAADLLGRPAAFHEVGGHTDAIGDDASNLDLSQRRAETVRAYLVGKGVPEGQLTAVGYGETQPLDSNGTPEGRARNRRVELKVLEGDAAAPPAAEPAS